MSNPTNDDVALMLERASRTSPTEVLALLNTIGELLGARLARFHVADYSLRTLQHIDAMGRVVRASLENLAVPETVRHLADNIVSFSADSLSDDATMLLMEYRPPTS